MGIFFLLRRVVIRPTFNSWLILACGSRHSVDSNSHLNVSENWLNGRGGSLGQKDDGDGSEDGSHKGNGGKKAKGVLDPYNGRMHPRNGIVEEVAPIVLTACTALQITSEQ